MRLHLNLQRLNESVTVSGRLILNTFGEIGCSEVFIEECVGERWPYEHSPMLDVKGE